MSKKKKPLKAKDPIRYPKIIAPMESLMKSKFKTTIQKTVVDLTKEMVKAVK